MNRPSMSAIPRGVLAVFVLLCTFFAVSTLWVILPAFFHPLHYFLELLQDSQLKGALENTLILFLLSTGLEIFICFVGTLFVTSVPRGVMAMLLVPYAAGVVAPAFAFYVLLSTGIGPLNVPLASSIAAQRLVIALVDTWQWIGILLFAVFITINQIPRSSFQLAQLEGMGRWKRWRRIVWPQIWMIFLLYAGFRLLDWLRKVDVVKAIYDRGQAAQLQTLSMYMEQVYFQSVRSISGSSIQLHDPYSYFLALLQLAILVIAAFFISRRRTVSERYEAGRIAVRNTDPTRVRAVTERISVAAFWLVIFVLIVAPLFWIGSLSVQNVDLSGLGALRFHLIPTHWSLTSYRKIWDGNGNGGAIHSGLVYSFGLCAVAAVIACLLAISAMFLFVADSHAERLRGPVLAFGLSIFFFPPVIAVPALSSLHSWLPWLFNPLMQLEFVYSSNAFVLGFVLLLILCMTVPRADFDLELLERESRVHAFYSAYVKYEFRALTFIWVLAFSSAWSEFYVSGFVTSIQANKPFSVILEMSHTQYNTDYSLFAAGALLSLCVCFIPPTVIVALSALWRRWSRSRGMSTWIEWVREMTSRRPATGVEQGK